MANVFAQRNVLSPAAYANRCAAINKRRPKLIFRKRDDNNEMFDELRNWRGAIDTPSYAHAVNERLPDLSNDEIVFLWNRALAEQKSDDDERQWFGEITIANIVSFLPNEVRRKDIPNLDLSTFSNKKVKAILLLQLSKLSTGDKREELQKEAWENAAFYCDDPIENPSSMHASALKWSSSKEDSDNEVWIDTIIYQFDSAVIHAIWQDYLSQAQSGNISRKDEFARQVHHLAKKLPSDKILKYCHDCFDVYKETGRVETIAKTIEILIAKLSEAEQPKTWKLVIEYGFEQEPSSIPYYHPEKLAKYLEKIRPDFYS
jgi:hypothetical protein